MRKLSLLLLFCTTSALATTGSARYNRETITISSAACPTGAPGLDSDGDPWGISLYDLRGFKVRVCPAAGQTITGNGALKVCTYSPSPYGDGTWALSPELSWDMTGKVSIGTSNPCLEFTHLMTVVSLPGERVFVYPSTDFGVSGGTTVRIYLSGESR